MDFNFNSTTRMAGLLMVLVSSPARADRRAYGETYEAVTAPKGELDIELWTTYARLGEVDGGPASRGVRQMIELEYGLTDRWDVALYNMLDVITAGDTASGYAGFKIESRYRPTERGEWIVDPVFYLEVQERLRGDAKQSLEGKLILARDVGHVNTALNLALEEERLDDGSYNTEFEWAFGTSYAFSPAVIAGAEVFGKSEKADMGGLEHRLWAGPSISFATSSRGVMRGIWVTLAAGGGLTDESDRFYARTVVGLQF